MKKSEETSNGILKRCSSLIYSIMDKTIGWILKTSLELLAFLGRTTVGSLLLLILLFMAFMAEPARPRRKTFTSSIKTKTKPLLEWLWKQMVKSIKLLGILINLIRPSKESPSLLPLVILISITSLPILLAMGIL